MNPDIREEWITALLSGDYPQGKAYLHRGGKWCCLGVLSDLAVKAGVIPPPTEHDGVYTYGALAEGALLPDEVSEWAGINHTGLWETESIADCLSTRNDHGATFEEIAELIREHF
jgi:hypothetical protein